MPFLALASSWLGLLWRGSRRAGQVANVRQSHPRAETEDSSVVPILSLHKILIFCPLCIFHIHFDVFEHCMKR